MYYGNQANVPGAAGNLAGAAPLPIIPVTDPRRWPVAPGPRPFGGGSTPPPPRGTYPMASDSANMGEMAMLPIGGSVPFTPEQEEKFQNWLQNSPEGERLRNLKERINQKKGLVNAPSDLPATPMASMYMGPQMGQQIIRNAPANFDRKFVS